MHDEELRAGLGLLRQTIVFPWESVDQVVREHGGADLGDPQTPGTGAWHLRHIVEIFRLHARTVMGGLGAPGAEIDGVMPAPEGRVDGPPREVRDALLRDVDAFSAWVLARPAPARETPLTYGGPTTLREMLVCMTLHITFHAAAVHYWRKWRSPG